MNVQTSTDRRDRCPQSPGATKLVRKLVAAILLPVGLLAACSEHGVLQPAAPGAAAAIASTKAHAGVVVTPNYSAFDARPEFNGAGIIGQLNAFDGFSGGLVYPQVTPWTSGGVTYTSSFNIVLAPGLGLGVPSNSISTNFGQPITGTLPASDAFTLFGADLTLIGVKVPVSVVVQTNLGSYSFANLDIPLATSGTRFFGIGLANPGEHITGFTFSYGGSTSTGLLLDNVALGHVADANTPPVASAGGPYAANEGSAVTLALSASDADDDALTFTWDLGDGTTGSGPTPPSSHVYAENGSYDVTLMASDGNGGTHSASATVAVANVAPAVAPFTVPSAPLALMTGGVKVNVSTTFTDPGSLDEHTARLDCGVGAAAVSPAPNGVFTGTCTFEAAGVYAVQLTVQDDDGDAHSVAATGQVVVYDAAAGWVTGGGWIASPEGAFVAAPTVTGKLTFGFVARYQASATAPNGNAEFKLQVAKLDFRSTSLDWLIVSQGSAHLRGRGTVNGGGDFEFALTAIDGAPTDAIRIRIWNRENGDLVYDNRPDAGSDDTAASTLAGGTIQIHVR